MFEYCYKIITQTSGLGRMSDIQLSERARCDAEGLPNSLRVFLQTTSLRFPCRASEILKTQLINLKWR
jgi:hypothetical protein